MAYTHECYLKNKVSLTKARVKYYYKNHSKILKRSRKNRNEYYKKNKHKIADKYKKKIIQFYKENPKLCETCGCVIRDSYENKYKRFCEKCRIERYTIQHRKAAYKYFRKKCVV